jgi:hypothetical protein
MKGILSHNLPNRRYSKIYIFVFALIMISIACNAPTAAKQAAPDKEPGFVETSVAQTMIARNAGQDQGDASQGDQAGQEQDSEPAEEVTDTPTLTPTVTDTPTPEVAMVYSSANTNCRTGPDTAWPAIFTMYEGDSAEAIARGSVGDYWYINIPDQPGNMCVMWGKYATPSGPYELLPEWTPMPTPTQSMNFKISFHSNIGNCGPFWYLQYRIDNIGGIKLESWRTMSTDHTGGSDPIENIQDKFYDITGCGPSGHQEDLTPGEAYYVNAIFDNNPVGHDITVKVKICKKNGLAGQCVVNNYRHKP